VSIVLGVVRQRFDEARRTIVPVALLEDTALDVRYSLQRPSSINHIALCRRKADQITNQQVPLTIRSSILPIAGWTSVPPVSGPFANAAGSRVVLWARIAMPRLVHAGRPLAHEILQFRGPTSKFLLHDDLGGGRV